MSATAEHIRGSSVLLLGRVLAQGMELATLILLVRSLSKSDYGAFSYGLSVVLLFASLSQVQLPETLARFLPLYREGKRDDALLGSILLALGTVVGLGAFTAVGIVCGVTVLHLRPIADTQALRLLAILAFLIPLENADGLFNALFAVFGRARTIVLRQSVLAPALRLALVGLLVWRGEGVQFLAAGYVVITGVGAALYAVLFWRLLHGAGLRGARQDPAGSPVDRSSRRYAYPARELFGFALPLLSTSMVWLLIESSDAVLLGHFRNAAAVATFRAVAPIARYNQSILLIFGLLYTPQAARLYARRDSEELSHLYWQTALWMTILSVPILIMTLSFARTTAVGLFGRQYADATPVMALLALGYFLHGSLGFNGTTVKIFGRLRFSVTVDLLAAVLNVVIGILLVPRYGPAGAAIATAGTLIVHNVLKQAGLWRCGIGAFPRSYIVPYLSVALLTLGLWGLAAVVPLNLPVAVILAGLAGLVALLVSRGALRIDTVFPEMSRSQSAPWPLVRAVLSPPQPRRPVSGG